MYSLDTRYAFDTEYQDLQFHGDTLPDEEKTLRRLMQEGQIAALSRVQVHDPRQTARLCFECALEHPEAVIALLWHDGVRDALIRLLEDPPHHDRQPDRWERATALVLESGLAPDKVVNAQRGARRRSSDGYWQDKAQAHEGFSWQAPETKRKAFQRGLPVPYQHAHVDSLVNRNGKINDAFCRHMAREAQTAFEQGAECFKRYLSEVAEGRYPLNTAGLERRHQEHVRESRDRRVQFTPERLGGVLVRLLALMQPQERRGFLVSWCLSVGDDPGHEVSVLLEKVAGGMNKVWWYDPNLSGNAMHLRALPEDLSPLGVDAFDTLDCVQHTTHVLSIDIEDQALAETWAGQFIPRDDAARMASFVEALANGTVHEMAAALESITDWGVFQNRHAEVREALTWALQYGHARAIRSFARWVHGVEVVHEDSEGAPDDADADTDAGSEQAVALWTRTLNDETFLDHLALIEDGVSRSDTARAYLELLEGASRHLDRASRRALYKSLDAFQNSAFCGIELYSSGYRLLRRDAGFRTAFEQLMAKLKFW